MANFEIAPLAESVSFKFKCPNCGKESQSESFDVPVPNMLAETHHDSVEQEHYEVVCEHCGEEYRLTITNGIYEGMGELEDIDNIWDIEETYPGEDDYYYDFDLFKACNSEIDDALNNIKFVKEPSKSFLIKLLYASVITYMETYLGNTLKNMVLNNDKYIKLLIEDKLEFKDLSKELETKYNIKLESSYSINEELRKIIKDELDGLLYHDLKKVNRYYEKLFGINFGDIRFLLSAVRKRHNIVHRNGKTIDGNMVTITEEDVKELSEKVHAFLYELDCKMAEVEKKDSNDTINR